MDDSIEVEQISCCICGKSETQSIASGTDREYFTSSAVFYVVQCKQCKLLYLNPRPQANELSKIYPSSYHSYIIDTELDSMSWLTRMRYKAHTKRFTKVLKYTQQNKKIDLLDVGCGDGWMLSLFQKTAPDRLTTYGVEISPEVCKLAENLGHKIYCGRIEDVIFNRSFDLINYNHVIEHVSNPKEITQKSFDILKPNGILVYETPNANTLDWFWFRKGNWGVYHFPRHWYFFTPETIRGMGEAIGFEYVDHYFHPGPTHWVWTMHNLFFQSNNLFGRMGKRFFDPVKIFRGGVVPFCLLGFFTLLDLMLIKLSGRSSVMTVIFRKPDDVML